MSGKRLDSKPALEPAYNVRDLMELTGLGRQKIKRMMREGLLPGIVDGRSYTCPRSLWDAWCERRRHPQPGTPTTLDRMVHHRPVRDGGRA